MNQFNNDEQQYNIFKIAQVISHLFIIETFENYNNMFIHLQIYFILNSFSLVY